MSAPTTPRRIAALDVPLQQVAAEAQSGARYVIGRNGVFATLYDRQTNQLVLDNATEDMCLRYRNELIARDEALLLEQRHQYLDLDPDSACCPDGFTCVNCPPGGDR